MFVLIAPAKVFAPRDTVFLYPAKTLKHTLGGDHIHIPDSVQLTEDIPTGVLPMMELGRAAGLEMPLMNAMVDICSSPLDLDFRKGRSLEALGLAGMSINDIINYLS